MGRTYHQYSPSENGNGTSISKDKRKITLIVNMESDATRDILTGISNHTIYMVIVSIAIIFGFIIIAVSIGYYNPSVAYLPCQTGFCSTNIYTGIKVCPADPNSNIPYNPVIESCNPPTACITPTPCVYAFNTNGTSCPGDPGYTGECPNGEICRCNSRVYCPDFVSAYFTLNDVHSDTNGEIPIYFQSTVWSDPSGLPRSDLPLSPKQYNQTTPGSTKFCGVSPNNIDKIWPYGECISGQIGYNEPDNLWYCMNTDLICEQGEYVVRNIDGDYNCQIIYPAPFNT
jgi:hypothetical protein